MAHFSHKQIDDDLSQAAYELYLKQLDSQKRFLLKEDVARLNAYQDRIDDEMNLGKVELPSLGAEILNQRIRQVEEMVKDILSRDVSIDRPEKLETDPEKLDYCA